MGKKLNDFLVATGKGAVSIFPGGGFLAEYIGLAQSYVADKRMDEWKSMVEEVLQDIPRTVDDLAKDETFYSCIQVATMGAMRAFQQEKRILFANALYSSAVNLDIDEDKKMIYITLLGDYTLSHIMLLNYFSENRYAPEDDVSRSGMVTIYRNIGATEHPMKGIVENLPELANDTSFIKHMAEQLCSDGLITSIDFTMPVSKEQARAKRTTAYGDDFLGFINKR